MAAMNRLIKKSGLYFIGNLSSKITIALVIPIYAIFVDTAELGIYDAALSVATMVAPVCFLAIWESILRFLLSNDESGEKAFSTVILFSVSCAVLFLPVMGLLVLLFQKVTLLLGLMVYTMAVFYGMAVIWQYLARSVGRSDCYAKASVVSALTSFALIVLLVCVLRLGLYGLWISYIAGQLTITLYIEFGIHAIRWISLSGFDGQLLRRFLKYSAPLSANLLLVAYIASSARLLVIALLGADSNGLYSFAYKFGSAISVFGGVISMAVIEEMILRIDGAHAEEFFQEAFNSMVSLMLAVCTVSVTVIYCFYLLLGKDNSYSGTLTLVPPLLAYGFFSTMATNLNSVFQARQDTTRVFFTAILGAITVTVTVLVGIKAGGLFGAAVGQALGAFVLMISRFRLSKDHIRYSFEFKRSLLPIFSFVVSSIALFCEDAIIRWTLLAAGFVAALIIGMQSFGRIRQIRDE